MKVTDIDRHGVGTVAEKWGHSCDQDWNSARSKPIEQFLARRPTAQDLANSRLRLQESLEQTNKENHALYQQLTSYRTQPRLDTWRSQLIWAWNQALWDAPSKVLADDEPDPQLLQIGRAHV